MEYHFLSETHETLQLVGNAYPRLKQTITRLSKQHQCIQRAVLCLSALHLGHMHHSERTKYVDLARRYYSEALQLFRGSITQITQDNLEAIKIFIVFVAIFSFNASPLNDASSTSNVLEVLEPFLALRIGMLLVRRHGNFPPPWPLQILVDRRNTEERDGYIIMRLKDIEQTISEAAGEEHQRECCLEAIRLLRECVEYFGTSPKTWLDVAWWPCSLSQNYINLLLGRDPAATDIFICWCRFLRNAPSKWFWDGWVDKAIGALLHSGDDSNESVAFKAL